MAAAAQVAIDAENKAAQGAIDTLTMPTNSQRACSPP
jgi:hypothetical protein